MPLIKIEHHRHERHVYNQPDLNLVWNERMKLIANFFMSMAYVLATAFTVALVARVMTPAGDTAAVLPFAVEMDELTYVAGALAAAAIVFISLGYWTLGRLRL